MVKTWAYIFRSLKTLSVAKLVNYMWSSRSWYAILILALPLELLQQWIIYRSMLYTKAEDAIGKVILSKEPKVTQVFTPQTAFIMRDLLKGPLTLMLDRRENMPIIENHNHSSNWFLIWRSYLIILVQYG